MSYASLPSIAGKGKGHRGSQGIVGRWYGNGMYHAKCRFIAITLGQVILWLVEYDMRNLAFDSKFVFTFFNLGIS